LIPELSRGFASTADNTLVVFDLTSLRKTANLAIPGKSPNHLTYDPLTKRVFVMNNRSHSVVAVSNDQPALLKTISLVDDPEAAVADANGHLYVVLADPAEIAVIDTSRLMLLQRIQLSPCIEARGVKMDVHARRLFVGCSNGLLAVADPDLYRLVARLPVEPNSGNVSFDSASNLMFLSNPTGLISVVSQRFPDRYRVVSSIPTKRCIADTVLDTAKHHLIVLATARRPGCKSQMPKWPHEMIITIGKFRE
jgi:DNA-binding beta-propeller fold protein YncE